MYASRFEVVTGVRLSKSWNVIAPLKLMSPGVVLAVCVTLKVRYFPVATVALMSGLLDVTVNVCGVLAALPSRGTAYPRLAGTETEPIGASAAASS